MAAQNAAMRQRIAGARQTASDGSDMEDGTGSGGGGEAGSADESEGLGADEAGDAVMLRRAVGMGSRRAEGMSLDEEVARMWSLSDKYKFAAQRRGRRVVRWAQRRHIAGPVLEELYLFLKERVQGGGDLETQGERVCGCVRHDVDRLPGRGTLLAYRTSHVLF